jgi:integrase
MFTVAHLVDSFDAHLRVRVACGEISEKTREAHGYQLAKLGRVAGRFPAAELRAHHLIGVELTHHFVRSLKAAYKWAAEDDQQLVPRHPFKALRTPPTGRRERTLTPEEFRRLLRAVNAEYRRFLLLMAHTTVRPGEARLLTWSQVDFPNRSLVLTKFKGRRMRRDGLKVRHVPLTDVAARLLSWLRDKGSRPTGPDAPVFLDRYKQPPTPNGIRCMIRRARAKAGLEPAGHGERIVCYSLRHTSATDRVRSGMPENVLSVIMGHTNPGMTRRYQHLKPADLVTAVDRAAAEERERRKKRPA